MKMLSPIQIPSEQIVLPRGFLLEFLAVVTLRRFLTVFKILIEVSFSLLVISVRILLRIQRLAHYIHLYTFSDWSSLSTKLDCFNIEARPCPLTATVNCFVSLTTREIIYFPPHSFGLQSHFVVIKIPQFFCFLSLSVLTSLSRFLFILTRVLFAVSLLLLVIESNSAELIVVISDSSVHIGVWSLLLQLFRVVKAPCVSLPVSFPLLLLWSVLSLIFSFNIRPPSLISPTSGYLSLSVNGVF